VYCVAASWQTYPIQKKELTYEFLREHAHLRPRTRLFSSVLHVRDAVQYGLTQFFKVRTDAGAPPPQCRDGRLTRLARLPLSSGRWPSSQNSGFTRVDTPILTSNDCEGGGEAFQAVAPRHKGSGDSSNDLFFGAPAYLTVSGQLQVRRGTSMRTTTPAARRSRHAPPGWGAGPPTCSKRRWRPPCRACTRWAPRSVLVRPLAHTRARNGRRPSDLIARCISFRHRAETENSQTPRHLAEFWMLEAEIAFVSQLDELTTFVETMLKQTVRHVLGAAGDELMVLENEEATRLAARQLPPRPRLRDRLTKLTQSAPIPTIAYGDAVAQLSAVQGKTWRYPPLWVGRRMAFTRRTAVTAHAHVGALVGARAATPSRASRCRWSTSGTWRRRSSAARCL